MAFEFRLPQFTGSDKEQLAQIKSYLYQFIPKLEWALNTLAEQTKQSNHTEQEETQWNGKNI